MVKDQEEIWKSLLKYRTRCRKKRIDIKPLKLHKWKIAYIYFWLNREYKVVKKGEKHMLFGIELESL
jgi:hypothetical protein